MPDHDIQRSYRLLDSTKRLRPISGRAGRVDCESNSLASIYLVVESIKLDSRHHHVPLLILPTTARTGNSMA
jgi:hypothetical protein